MSHLSNKAEVYIAIRPEWKGEGFEHGLEDHWKVVRRDGEVSGERGGIRATGVEEIQQAALAGARDWEEGTEVEDLGLREEQNRYVIL